MRNSLHKVLDHMLTGVAIVTTSVAGTPFGMTASWVSRVSNRPFMISISIAQRNFTHNMLGKSKSLGLNIMGWEAKDTIYTFW